MSSRADVASAGKRGFRRAEWVRYAVVSFVVWPAFLAGLLYAILLIAGRVVFAVFQTSFVTPTFGGIVGLVLGLLFAVGTVTARRSKVADVTDPDIAQVVTYKRVQDLPPSRRFGEA